MINYHKFYRNPDSAHKNAITDCKLITVVLLLNGVLILWFFLYVVVEVSIPGYELQTVPNEDQLTGLVGV